MEENCLFKVLHDFLALRLVRLLKVRADVVNEFTIRNGNKDVLVHMCLLFIHLLDDGNGNFSEAVGAALEVCHRCFECSLEEVFLLHRSVFFSSEGRVHRHDFDETVAASIVVSTLFHDVDTAVPNHI